MRQSLLFALLGFLGLILYQNMQQPQLRLNPLLDRLTHPFDQRIRYRIAEVDPRFGLNEHELKQISQQATDIWKQGLGQDYFVYDPMLGSVFDSFMTNVKMSRYNAAINCLN